MVWAGNETSNDAPRAMPHTLDFVVLKIDYPYGAHLDRLSKLKRFALEESESRTDFLFSEEKLRSAQHQYPHQAVMIGHPRGSFKRISTGEFVSSDDLASTCTRKYTIPSRPGNSGSPVIPVTK